VSAILGMLLMVSACDAPQPPPKPVAPSPVPKAAPVRAAPAPSRIPQAALRWQRTLTREVRLYWGLSQPVAIFAAQIHQESTWRPDARSSHAEGLGQQTPVTEKWLAEIFPADLGDGKGALDPHWSIRALVMYDRKLWSGRQSAASDEHRWAFTLADYNGGSGWVNKETLLARRSGADATRWFCGVEHYQVRGQAAWTENRAYPARILRTLRPLYEAWG